MKRFILSMVLGLAAPLLAAVELADVFNSHMVLQRERIVPVWGTAAAGEVVTVTFKGQKASATADAEGRWEVRLGPEPHGGPFALVIQGSNTVELTDVLVGDVWIFSGQSNAPWGTGTPELLPFAEELMAKTTTVRHGRLARLSATAEQPETSLGGRVVWSLEEPKKSFALPVFFLYPINLATGIPQGYVLTARAGTSIEPWIPLEGYDAVEGLDAFKEQVRILRPGTAEYKAHSEKQFGYLRQWIEQAQLADQENQPVPALDIPPRVHRTRQHQFPTCLYNGSFAPLAPMAIRGVFWYQGESNAGDPDYQRKLMAFTSGIRRNFRSPDASFFIVQPPPCEWYGLDNARLPELWEQQLAFADADGNSFVAATGDIGDVKDLHPGGRSKEHIARRLSNLALKHLFAQPGIHAEFPRFASSAREGAQLVLNFKHVDSFVSADGGPIRHFEIAGTDGRFHPAEARIDGNRIVVKADAVTEPVDVRYCWSNVAIPNLHNEAGLPPYAFRTKRERAR